MGSVTLDDLSLGDCGLTSRVSDLRDVYFRALPEICTERPLLVTRFSRKAGLFEKKRISILDKARVYRGVLESRTAVAQHTGGVGKGFEPFTFHDRQLFAGSTTTKLKGVPLYPEFLALTLWPELWTITRREHNPFGISREEVEALNQKVFPFWMEHNLLELARNRCREEGDEKHLFEMELNELLVFFLASKPDCISHTIPDFSRALVSGMGQIIDVAQDRKRSASDLSRKEFYAAVAEVLAGIVSYSRRLADAAGELAGSETDPARKRELLDMAEIHRRVPEFPARNFREGLTTVWICWTAIHLENPNIGLSLGRLDQVLYDLYRRDMEQGALTIQEAVELICCFWLKIGDHVPAIPEAAEQLFGGSGSNQAITVGGVDKMGRDAVNDLTYVMLRATELMKLRDPNLNARYFPGVNAPEYLRRICEVNIETGATPAIHNDRAAIRALTGKGDSLEHARDYGVVGCVEPGSNGRSYGHTGALLINLSSALELALFDGTHRHVVPTELISKRTGKAASFETFEAFRAAFAEQTRWLVDRAVSLNNFFGRIHQDFYPTPILSALFEGPLDKGKDLIEGGALINSSGVAVVGLADVADSLSAVQTVVFKEGLPFADLMDALEKDFQDYEILRARLMNPDKTPKYGNDDPVADENVVWIVDLLDRAFGEKQNYRGGGYRVGYWTMTTHAGFGRVMKALPSGRRAGESFTSGITPVSRVTPGLPEALCSVAKIPAGSLSNGVALNLKYTPDLGNREKMLNDFAACVEGYFDEGHGNGGGGMEIQFNVTSHQELVDAVHSPEKHQDLLVRVSGYTAYFKDLNPRMQKEIIDRTEYLLDRGVMVPYEPFPLPEKKEQDPS